MRSIVGFTLVELIVVSAVLGTLAVIGFISYQGYISSSTQQLTKNNLKLIALGQTEFKSEFGYFLCGDPSTSDHTNTINQHLFNGNKTIQSDGQLTYQVIGLDTSSNELSASDCSSNPGLAQNYILKGKIIKTNKTYCLRNDYSEDC